MRHLYAIKYNFDDRTGYTERRGAESAEKAVAQILAENPGSKLVAVWAVDAEGYDPLETIGPIEAGKRCKKAVKKTLTEVAVNFFERTGYSLYTNDIHPKDLGFYVEVLNLELQLASYKK